jgi:hypothetical protein
LHSLARATIETNADGEWHRRKSEAAMTEPIETSKAWCKSWPDRKAAGPDEPCVCRKSDSAILMMKAAEDRL